MLRRLLPLALLAVLALCAVAPAHAAPDRRRTDTTASGTAASEIAPPVGAGTAASAGSALTLQPLPGTLLPGLTGGGWDGAVASVRGDVLSGGIAAKLIGTLISGGVKGSAQHVGATVGVISAAKSVLDPAFLLGNLPGGVLGAAAGAAIPLPSMLAELGLGGEILGFAPPLLGAMFGSAFAMQAFDLARDGRLNLHDLLDRVDVKSLLAQAAGIDLAIVAARHLIPALMLGPVNLTEVGAALLGGWLASRVFDALRKRKDRRSSSMLATGMQGPIPAALSAPTSSTGPAATKTDGDWLADRLEAAYRAYLSAEQRRDAPAARAAHAEYVALARALQTASSSARH